MAGTASPAVVADFDNDGFDDLLLPTAPSGASAGAVIFSFGRAESAVVSLAAMPHTHVATAAPWDQGGPPLIVVRAGRWWETPSMTLLRFNADRSITLIDTIPSAGHLVELDGAAPPELVENHLGNIAIRSHDGESWTTAATLGQQARFGATSEWIAVADYDRDGREELVFIMSPQLSGISGHSDFRLIRSAGTPAETIIGELPSSDGWVTRIEPVELPDGYALAIFRPAFSMTDALGNPVSIGPGIRAALRVRPLDPNHPQGDLLPHDIPRAVAAADLNGDGLPDLAVAGSGRLTYLINPFVGNAPKPRVHLPCVADSIVLGDLDGDEKADTLTAGGTDVRAWRTAGNQIVPLSSLSTFPLHAPTRIPRHRGFELRRRERSPSARRRKRNA